MHNDSDVWDLELLLFVLFCSRLSVIGDRDVKTETFLFEIFDWGGPDGFNLKSASLLFDLFFFFLFFQFSGFVRVRLLFLKKKNLSNISVSPLWECEIGLFFYGCSFFYMDFSWFFYCCTWKMFVYSKMQWEIRDGMSLLVFVFISLLICCRAHWGFWFV